MAADGLYPVGGVGVAVVLAEQRGQFVGDGGGQQPAVLTGARAGVEVSVGRINHYNYLQPAMVPKQ